MMNLVLNSFSSSVIRLSHNLKNVKNFSNISKDIAKQTSLASQTDLLGNSLKESKSIEGVFELVNTHYKIMNQNHIIQALRTIFMVQKHGKSAISTSQILSHPDFGKLCHRLKYHAGAIEIKDTIDALKIITFVGVSSDSTIYQILLQLLRHNVNQLSLHQIIFLDFLLSKTAKPSPLVEALQIALPIVYDVQLPIKLDATNAVHLAEHLHFISRKTLSEKTIMLIINSLMQVKFFHSKTSVSIIWSICDMPASELLEPLLSKAIKSLMRDSSGIPYHDLETIITKLVIKYSTRMPFYYDESLFDRCAQVVVTEDLGFETAVHLLRKFLRVNHISNDLLNYISLKCYENPVLIENGDPILTNAVVCGCAMTDFRPVHYDTIKKHFLKIKSFNWFDIRDIHPIKLQVALSVLDIYIPEILEQCLNEVNLDLILKRNMISDSENIILISQAIKTFRPEYSSYLPTDNFLRRIKKQTKTSHPFPMEGSLFHVFGGENYVKTEVSTEMLHNIDHVILLKRGNIPSVIKPENVEYIEDIQCDTRSEITLVMVLHRVHYTINNKQLKGSTSLMLKTLEAQGYSVVPVSLELWTSLPEFERLPYIMEIIKSKTEYFDKAYDIT